MGEIPSRSEELPEEQKRETGISKIIGATVLQERAYVEILKRKSKESIELPERVKTAEEIRMIEAVLDKMPDFIRKYNGNPVDVNLGQIRLVDQEKTQEMFGDSEMDGVYDQQKQLAIVLDSGSMLANAHAMVHEVLHLNSFQSLEIKKSEENIKLKKRRTGFGIHDEQGNKLFDDIDESVIQKLTILFDQEHFASIPELSQEAHEREKNIKYLVEQNPAEKKFIETASLVKKDGQGEWAVTSGRFEERERFDTLIEQIYEKNQSSVDADGFLQLGKTKLKVKFESSEDVFNLFSSTVMSGKILEVSRLVEMTYGKGSFRELGKEIKEK